MKSVSANPLQKYELEPPLVEVIPFDMETKRKVVELLLRQLKQDGYLFVGHSESLNGVTNMLTTIIPSVYRKT